MKRLLYISTSRTDPDEAMLRTILAVSRRNNAAVGVTGALVVGGRRFLQALEGNDLAVDQVYQRIRADPRHFAAVVLSEQTITDRYFPDWSMGYEAGAASHASDLPKVVADMTAGVIDPTLRAYFTSFAALHAAA